MVEYVDMRNKISSRYVQKGGESKVNLSEALDKVVKRVKERISNEIPDRGFFRSFAENFDPNAKPDIYGKNIALFVERDESREGRAFLGISVLHPTISLEASTYLMNDTREGLLEYINKPEFKKELEETVLQLSESLKNQG